VFFVKERNFLFHSGISKENSMLEIIHCAVRPLIWIFFLWLTACASTPRFDISDTDVSLIPTTAAEQASGLQGRKVLWGGMVISAVNLGEQTQIEILGYPLNDRQRPDTSQPVTGRFLARYDGYLELTDFHAGRLLTLSGQLDGTSEALIGQHRYTYSLVRISDVQLWQGAGAAAESQVHFGFGVLLHN
jgi:outer membrane lipoprotein